MRILALALLLLTSCSRSYYEKKNGDLDVAVIMKRVGCKSSGGPRACELLRDFDAAEEAIRSPKKRDRYVGWFNPIGPGGSDHGDGVALVVERNENDAIEATVIPIGRTSDGMEKEIRQILAGKKKDEIGYEYFETQDSPRALEAIAGTKSMKLQLVDRITYVRRDGERLLMVHLGSSESTSFKYGYTKAPVWVGELRRVEE